MWYFILHCWYCRGVLISDIWISWWHNHKDQWRGALMFSLICAWINGWVNDRDAGDLRKCIWKCRLWKWRPFCPGGDEFKNRPTPWGLVSSSCHGTESWNPTTNLIALRWNFSISYIPVSFSANQNTLNFSSNGLTSDLYRTLQFRMLNLDKELLISPTLGFGYDDVSYMQAELQRIIKSDTNILFFYISVVSTELFIVYVGLVVFHSWYIHL